MDKEKPIFHTDGGFSEKQMDLAVDNPASSDPANAGNIFDPQKKNPPADRQGKKPQNSK